MVVQVAWRDVTLISSRRVDEVASMNMIENWITKPKGPSTMPTAKARACTILVEFERAQTELVGKAVILTDGTAGTVDRLWLDELHGLRISIRSHDGKWPVAAIKFAQK